MSSRKQIERITYFENILDEVHAAIEELEQARERLEELQPKVDELAGYYESRQWRKDFADDEKGLLPADLKRGILSEDAIYDLLSEYQEITKTGL